jgi:uncharacterized protein YciI
MKKPVAVTFFAVLGLVAGAWLMLPDPSSAQSSGAQPAAALGPDFDKLLKKTLWVIETRPVPGAADNPEVLRNHMYHQRDLEKQGVMFGAGPVSNAKGEFEYGMIIVRAESREAAQRIADSDPMHIAKLRTYTLHQWLLNEGQMKISVNFSDGTYRFE